jgi:hypothetical protein
VSTDTIPDAVKFATDLGAIVLGFELLLFDALDPVLQLGLCSGERPDERQHGAETDHDLWKVADYQIADA